MRSDRIRENKGLTVRVEILDDVREGLLRLLVEIGDGDTSGENRVIWKAKKNKEMSLWLVDAFASRELTRMLGGHVRGSLGGEVVQFDGGDSSVNTGDDTLRNLSKKSISLASRGNGN